MLLGTYSIPHLVSIYRDPSQRSKITTYAWLVILGFVVWLTAFVLLFYYWNQLELWAQVFALIGLFFNVGGSIFSILVIYLGMKDSMPQKSSVDSALAMTLLPESSSLPVSLPVRSIQKNQFDIGEPIVDDIPL